MKRREYDFYYDFAKAAAAGFVATPLKKYKSATTTTTDDEMREVTTQIGEYTKRKRTHGRYKKKNRRYILAALKASIEPVWLRWNGINQFLTTSAGYYKMFNHNNTASSLNYFPVHFYDLDMFFNYTDTAIVSPGNTGWFITNNASGVQVNVQTNLSPSAATINTPSIDNIMANATNASGAQPFRKARHKFSDIRMNLYGSTNNPTKYEVSIVRFKYYQDSPAFLSDLAPVQTTDTIALYQYLAQPFAFNPIHYTDTKMRDRITFVSTNQFMIEATQTNEGSSTIPHVKEFRLFKKWDRIHSFDWHDTGLLTAGAAGVGQTAGFPQVTTSMKNAPHYKYRHYLMVRALTPPSSSAIAPSFDVTKNPSYDLSIHQRWEIPV